MDTFLIVNRCLERHNILQPIFFYFASIASISAFNSSAAISIGYWYSLLLIKTVGTIFTFLQMASTVTFKLIPVFRGSYYVSINRFLDCPIDPIVQMKFFVWSCPWVWSFFVYLDGLPPDFSIIKAFLFTQKIIKLNIVCISNN